MKILILANNDVGLYKFRKELLIELSKNHEVYVCLPYGNLVSEIEKTGSRFIECHDLQRQGKNPVSDFKLFQFYRRILNELRPDMVFTYTIKPNIYGGMACSEKGIPYVVNITGLGTAVSNPGIMQKLTLFLYKRALKKSQKVFFQNQENLDFMVQKGVVSGDYDLIPGSGVNLDEYAMTPYPQTSIINFIFVARVMKEKGINQFIDAAKVLKKRYSHLKFHVYGFCEEDYSDVLQDLQSKGILEYHGMITDMVLFYQMASCIIHPSYYPEGISNVLLECAASGRPIITTNMSGCREVVVDGVTGFLVEKRNSEDLIEKIDRFVNLPFEMKQSMGNLCRKKVESEFDSCHVVSKYVEEINKRI